MKIEIKELNAQNLINVAKTRMMFYYTLDFVFKGV